MGILNPDHVIFIPSTFVQEHTGYFSWKKVLCLWQEAEKEEASLRALLTFNGNSFKVFWMVCNTAN
jgi:hypothetical protein